MKILKPGKVEQRKFVCPECGCEFVAGSNDIKTIREGFNEWRNICFCPTCSENLVREGGEPYEEPVQVENERLAALISGTPDIMIWPDALAKITEHLIDHGVTFKAELT